MFKYLFGKMRQNDETGEETHREDALAITRRCDSYQHRDMARDISMIPFNGGFCGSALNFDNAYLPGQFNGESVSCRVKTEGDAKKIEEFVKETDIFVCKFGKSEYLVALFIPKGNTVADPYNKEIKPNDWKKVSPEEFCALFKEVFDNPYYM
ncbi:hypothetical protein CF8_0178 [Aeromonas phage CF8]|nr:hypothetical protein CF8_0178 [Aeromonas phage CF8]